MILTRADVQLYATPSQIRAFNPFRDLGDLADLVQVSFADELESTGSHVVDDLRQMSLMGPALHLAAPFVELFGGYVWIEDGRLVGNVTLVEDERTHTWSISNVAVMPEHRERGIAAQLLDSAIRHVKRCRGRRILLQVRADNTTALGLYRRRGFQTYDTIHELDLPGSAWPAVIGETTGLRSVRASDSARLHRLVHASIPAEALRARPPMAQQYRRSHWDVLSRLWQFASAGTQRYELVAEGSDQLEAYGTLLAHLFRDPHKLTLRVPVEHRGRWERALTVALLHRARTFPRYHVQSQVSASHPEAVAALMQLGFRELRVLEQMCLSLMGSDVSRSGV